NSLGNVITGNAGDNLLDGRAGDDTLDGGAGIDILIGGEGHDTFVFKAGYGRDFVDGFTAGEDVIAFSTDLFADYAAAMATAVQAGDDVVFAIDADTTLTLWNAQLSALTADDFRFV
ncbi:calcium-binding protein, partial [Rhodoplanes azumiensis]